MCHDFTWYVSDKYFDFESFYYKYSLFIRVGYVTSFWWVHVHAGVVILFIFFNVKNWKGVGRDWITLVKASLERTCDFESLRLYKGCI